MIMAMIIGGCIAKYVFGIEGQEYTMLIFSIGLFYLAEQLGKKSND